VLGAMSIQLFCKVEGKHDQPNCLSPLPPNLYLYPSPPYSYPSLLLSLPSLSHIRRTWTACKRSWRHGGQRMRDMLRHSGRKRGTCIFLQEQRQLWSSHRVCIMESCFCPHRITELELSPLRTQLEELEARIVEQVSTGHMHCTNNRG